MSERFSDEVLREAIAARFKVLESREAHRIGFGTIEQLEAEQVEGLAAMRAVLEGHLADTEPRLRSLWLHGTDEDIGRQLREMSGDSSDPVKVQLFGPAASDGSPR